MKKIVYLFICGVIIGGGCKNNNTSSSPLDDFHHSLENEFFEILQKNPNEKKQAMENFYNDLENRTSYEDKGKDFLVFRFKIAALSCLDKYVEIEQLILSNNQYDDYGIYWYNYGMLYEKIGKKGDTFFEKALFLFKKENDLYREEGILTTGTETKFVFMKIIFLQIFLQKEVDPYPGDIDERSRIVVERMKNLPETELLKNAPIAGFVYYSDFWMAGSK